MGYAVHDAAGTACSCQPDSVSRHASNNMAASRAPTTRGVRSVPSAGTSVGETMPAVVTSIPPTAKLTSSSTSAASAAAAVGSGSSAARVGAASAAVSRSGSGRPTRPASSSTPTRSTSLRPRPLAASGTMSAGAPNSASTAQRFSVWAARPASSASSKLRSTSVVHSVSSTVRTPSRSASCSSVKAKSTAGPLSPSALGPQPRGSPSRRSATTLRWISLVPA